MIKEMRIDDASLKIKINFGIVLRVSGIFIFIQKIRKFKIKKYLKNLASLITSNQKPGDLVRVHSKEQILQTLDGNHKLDYCFFLDEMWQYFGSQHKVIKIVNYFYDERGAEMYKARNIVLFDGVHCSGKQGNLMPRCDRNC